VVTTIDKTSSAPLVYDDGTKLIDGIYLDLLTQTTIKLQSLL
jgi:hypothetical protein